MSTTKHEASREARWYMVDKDGAATLCVDEEDAKECAAHAFVAFPHMGPHRAVQLVEASTAGFTAADMATAAAQGFRDGVASVAANAGSEPVAWVDERALSWLANSRSLSATITTQLERGKSFERPMPLYTHPSPPEGMVGGWTKASQQLPPCGDGRLFIGVNSAGFACVFNEITSNIVGAVHCLYETAEECIDVMSGLDLWQPFTPPTSSADSRKGE